MHLVKLGAYRYANPDEIISVVHKSSTGNRGRKSLWLRLSDGLIFDFKEGGDGYSDAVKLLEKLTK